MKNNQKWISCFSLLSGLLFSASAAMAESEVYYLHSDHLGTTQVVTNSAQATVWKANYRPFGETDLVQTQVTYPLRFPGQYYDQESGTYYNYYRDYDPTLGRYIQSDPIGLEGGVNTYAYVGGRPVDYKDPYGLNPVAGALGGAAVGGPPGAIVGAAIGAGIGLWIGNEIGVFAKAPDNAHDPDGPKAPGKPGEDEGFRDPKGGENWVPNPNGPGYGWEDPEGNVWCPTGPGSRAHGGPHWDVQKPGGGYINVYPGGRRR